MPASEPRSGDTSRGSVRLGATRAAATRASPKQGRGASPPSILAPESAGASSRSGTGPPESSRDLLLIRCGFAPCRPARRSCRQASARASDAASRYVAPRARARLRDRNDRSCPARRAIPTRSARPRATRRAAARVVARPRTHVRRAFAERSREARPEPGQRVAIERAVAARRVPGRVVAEHRRERAPASLGPAALAGSTGSARLRLRGHGSGSRHARNEGRRDDGNRRRRRVGHEAARGRSSAVRPSRGRRRGARGTGLPAAMARRRIVASFLASRRPRRRDAASARAPCGSLRETRASQVDAGGDLVVADRTLHAVVEQHDVRVEKAACTSRRRAPRRSDSEKRRGTTRRRARPSQDRHPPRSRWRDRPSAWWRGHRRRSPPRNYARTGVPLRIDCPTTFSATDRRSSR